MSEIITELTPEFLREFEAEVLGAVPAEKVKADLKQAEIGRVLAAEGALAVEGLGQKLGEVDSRTFFRWAQENPGCWQDPAFVREFFKDNPQCRSPGWKPTASSLRHSVSFVGGQSVSNLNLAKLGQT